MSTVDKPGDEPHPTCGWNPDLPSFSASEPKVIRLRLQSFVRDAGESQVRAWRDSIPLLQRECRELIESDGEAGKLFVQGVRDYVRTYSRKASSVPPEHVLIFDEAQRAFDRDMIAAKHDNFVGHPKSEPDLFIEFAERIPGWGVVVGLIGSGQEIHVGEEGGIGQWRDAIFHSREKDRWTVHAPVRLQAEFHDLSARWEPSLDLNTEIRYHLSEKVHEFVEDLLADRSGPGVVGAVGDELYKGGHRFLVTRNLGHAMGYARSRYAKSPAARYGILASSKDKDLETFGLDNSFQTTKRLRVGPWYNADREDQQSCCRLETVATEFSAQGLELDLAILAWGTDLVRTGAIWSNAFARGYRPGAKVHDPMQLRRNAYRVLLTRGRDGTVVFVPTDSRLDDTYVHLVSCGFRELKDGE